MGYSGKPTYGAGSTLPELAEDISDVVGIVSPFETPLLALLGDPARPALSTVHEWIEDSLLPNRDQINDSTYSNALTDTTVVVDNGSYFRAGDLIKCEAVGCHEVILVTGVSTNTLTIVRGYGNTTAFALADNLPINIIGNITLEGADAAAARYANRSRVVNYTQIFAATVEVSGTMQAASAVGVADEVNYQKQNRIRELLRDLENSVINGAAAATNPEGTAAVKRSMNGIIKSLTTNVFVPNAGGVPAGGGGGSIDLNEAVLNHCMRTVWNSSGAKIDTIVVGGFQKRRINGFITTAQRHYDNNDRRLSDLIGIYESDFGVCNIAVSRYCPPDSCLLLDSSRIQVMPLRGRSFHFRKLGPTGDAYAGQVVGEYTLELKNQAAHAHIKGLSIT